MANRIKNINGVNIEMTDAEQTAFEAAIVAARRSKKQVDLEFIKK